MKSPGRPGAAGAGPAGRAPGTAPCRTRWAAAAGRTCARVSTPGHALVNPASKRAGDGPLAVRDRTVEQRQQAGS